MEKSFNARSGYLFLLLEILFLALAIAGFIMQVIVPAIILIVLFIVLAPGFTAVDPNQSYVLILFGLIKVQSRIMGSFGLIRSLLKRSFHFGREILTVSPLR